MSKIEKSKGIPDKEKHPALYKMAQKYSHTGNKPLTQSLYDDNVMVSQKMRKAQEHNNPSKVK